MTQLDKKIVLIVVVGALLLFAFRFLPVTNSILIAEVQLNGKTIRKVNIGKSDQKIIRISMPRGIAEMEVKNGAVRLLEMPDYLCPRKICSHIGWIRKPGETLICVPNRLVIRLTSNRAAPIDAVTK